MEEFELVEYIEREELEILKASCAIVNNPFICCDQDMTRINDYEVMCKICGRLVEKVISREFNYKRKVYDRNVYFRKNLYLILGISSAINRSDVDRVFRQIPPQNCDNIYKIRQILKRNRLMKYNVIAPLLLCKYARIIPPTYNATEIVNMCRLYTQIDHVHAAKGIRKNSFFYSFMIYKIIQVICDDDRIYQLSKFIYMPDFITLTKCMRIWEDIRSVLKLPKKIGYIIN